MSGSLNKVTLIGRVVADPEIKRTQDGRLIANLRIVTSETWKDKITGEKKEKAEWHRVVVFSPGLAKTIEQYIKKGASLYLEGQLQTRKWTDQSGIDRYSTEIILQGFNSSMVILQFSPNQSDERSFQANRQDDTSRLISSASTNSDDFRLHPPSQSNEQSFQTGKQRDASQNDSPTSTSGEDFRLPENAFDHKTNSTNPQNKADSFLEREFVDDDIPF